MNKKIKSKKKQFLSLIIVTILVAVVSAVYFNIDKILGKTKNENTLSTGSQLINDANLSIHFIDVGQGDSVFIELPDETNMLIDSGIPSKGDDVETYLKDLNVSKIDYLVVTHGDNDHVGGIPNILDKFEVKNIYRPFQFAVGRNNGEAIDGVNPNDDLKKLYTSSSKNIIENKAYNEFIEKAYTEKYIDAGGNEQSAVVSTTYDGLVIPSANDVDFSLEFFGPLKTTNEKTFIQTGDATVTLGYPTVYYGKSESKIKNSASCVILLEYNDGSYLFSGDAIEEQEQALVNSLNNDEIIRFQDVDVYHVAHHGSRDSSCEELLEIIKPKMSIITVGEGNTYLHPHEEALERLKLYSNENIFRSDKDGNILIQANQETIQIKTNTISGSLATKETGIDPVKEWYIYVLSITAFVFISGTIYILKNDYNYKKRRNRYKRS